MSFPKIDDYIRITKVSTKNEGAISDGYWAEGVLTRDIQRGSTLKMWRLRNSVNPRGRFGLFETTRINEIVGDLIETGNSTYRVEKVEVPAEFKNRKI